MIKAFADALMSARTNTFCGAEAEQTLASVAAIAYLLGVSTRRVEKLAEPLDVTQLLKSQVGAMSRHMDEQIAALRNRPLDAGTYAFVRVDALTRKV
ncbi:hypothetical protein BIV25_31975 [Streptomyces sp. MUSC 14]|uniref:transposase n=1 Tax=Streptomyces sp. MUSC 14 TaxID=1354889 RepID=UPI0008F5E521|nr:transposase [Streptomyces sp. MUSC 14]OIJ90340.1 hypothetical protein BIV25_31975 [Streptomyces sp. MUSC 14]